MMLPVLDERRRRVLGGWCDPDGGSGWSLLGGEGVGDEPSVEPGGVGSGGPVGAVMLIDTQRDLSEALDELVGLGWPSHDGETGLRRSSERTTTPLHEIPRWFRCKSWPSPSPLAGVEAVST